jgi:BNR repeat-like domain
MHRILLGVIAAGVLAMLAATSASAGPLTVASPVSISIPTPFAPGCGGATEGNFPGDNLNFPDSEVEPWLAVSPTNPNDVAGFWQQDRWSDGGAHGLVAAVSHDGGATFAHSWPHFSVCAGGTAANGGDFGRSSDPWVSWAPNGDLWAISLSVDRTTTRNAVLVSKMAAGSSTWTEPTTVRFDTSRAGIPLGNNFNDKESLTADPTDETGNLVYAVWDRIVSPNERAPASAFENARTYTGATWFARTTEGADADPDWEPARPIYNPGQHSQTISNQIVVTPDGTLVDGFFQFQDTSNRNRQRGTNVQVIRSTDKGETWSRRAIQVAAVHAIGETDPEPIHCRPYITGDPPCTLVRSDGVIIDLAVDYAETSAHHGRIYVTWQDHEDNPFGDDAIMLSYSDDGGRSWSVPDKVNQTPGGTFTDQAFEPAVHVNSAGDVAVSYYDFRNDVSGDGQLTTDHWLIHSHDGGATWSESHLGGPFDMHQAPYARGYFVGDYQGLDAQGTDFLALMTLASPATGSFPNPNPTDEFLVRAG